MTCSLNGSRWSGRIIFITYLAMAPSQERGWDLITSAPKSICLGKLFVAQLWPYSERHYISFTKTKYLHTPGPSIHIPFHRFATPSKPQVKNETYYLRSISLNFWKFDLPKIYQGLHYSYPLPRLYYSPIKILLTPFSDSRVRTENRYTNVPNRLE